MNPITSLQNPLIKRIASLHTTHERRAQGLFIIEGYRAVETASTRLTLEMLFYTEQQEATALKMKSQKKPCPVNHAVMKKISAATSPSGILGVFKIPPTPPVEKLKPGIVLAQISDPGNMGTLIRTAAACNVHSVIVIEGVDPWSPKVIQASAGTIALVDIFEWDWHALLAAKGSLKLYGLVVHGGSSQSIDPKNALIIVGNEARGIPQEWQKSCDSLITLPMPGGTESLNAAVAGSIVLYQTFVQY